MDYIILDSLNQWLGTCSKEDIEERIKEVRRENDLYQGDEIYIYEAKLVKTITI